MQSTKERRQALMEQLPHQLETVVPPYGNIIRAVLKEHGEEGRLTLPQFRTMQLLHQRGREGAINLELARRICVSPPSMTAMIDGLVERKLVDRSTDPENRRQVVIVLTEEGRERFEAISATVEEHLQRGLERLTMRELNELESGMRSLEKVISRLYSLDD